MLIDSKDAPKFGWWDMVRAVYFLLDTKRKRYLVCTIILILAFFYDLVPTFLMGRVVDFFTHYRPGASLSEFYLYVAILTVTSGVVALIRLTVKRKLSNIQSDVTYFTRVKGFERLLDFSIKWHDAENTGNKVQRIQNGTESLRQIQLLLSNEVFLYLTGIVGVLIAFTFLRPLFALYCLVYIGIFIFVQVSFYRRIVQMNNENNILLEKAGGTYYEGLSNILTIKTLGVKDDFKKNISSREELTRDHSIKRVTMMNNKWKSFQIVNALALGGVVFLSGQGFVAGSLTLGSLFIVYNYFQKLHGAVSQSTDVIDKIINAKVSIARMMPIFWEDSLVKQGHLRFPQRWESIRITDASFAYAHKEAATNVVGSSVAGLKGLNMTINKYEKIGVVGKSGSGKSTFAKMLLGLYEFNSGTFTVGESNFYDIKHDDVTDRVALVLQDSEMFNLSLKENITLMRKFEEGLFEKAIAIAQLGEVIKKLPNGVDTLIGEKGYRLSGGERQRIGIARAIYKNPQILVLDEATSSLDTKTESLIQAAFEKHLTKNTVISIAHRISTLKNVDRIFVFDDGRIVEEGKFAVLSKDSASEFYSLYKSQGKK